MGITWEPVGEDAPEEFVLHLRRTPRDLWIDLTNRLAEHTLCKWRGHQVEARGAVSAEIEPGVVLHISASTFCRRCGMYRDADGDGDL